MGGSVGIIDLCEMFKGVKTQGGRQDGCNECIVRHCGKHSRFR